MPIDGANTGLARGYWDAPRWVFFVIAVVAVVGALAFLGRVLRAAQARR